MKWLLIVMMLSIWSVGCTDAKMARWSNLGNSASIACYSGGKLIYEGASTGKISSELNSDGYFFKEKSTGKLMEVSGNCVIIY